MSRKQDKVLMAKIQGERSVRKMLHDVQSGRCFYCLSPTEFEHFNRDHLIPKSKGGKNALWNYVGSCKWCNSLKSNNSVHPDWVRERIELFNCQDWNRAEI